MGLSLIVVVALVFWVLGLLFGVMCGVAYASKRAGKVFVAVVLRHGAFEHEGRVYRVVGEVKG